MSEEKFRETLALPSEGEESRYTPVARRLNFLACIWPGALRKALRKSGCEVFASALRTGWQSGLAEITACFQLVAICLESEPDLKTGDAARRSRVRISPPPLSS
jgi:hypothetical protein